MSGTQRDKIHNVWHLKKLLGIQRSWKKYNSENDAGDRISRQRH